MGYLGWDVCVGSGNAVALEVLYRDYMRLERMCWRKRRWGKTIEDSEGYQVTC